MLAPLRWFEPRSTRRGMRAWPSLLGVALLAPAALGCGASFPDVVLAEHVDAAVEGVPVSLDEVETKKLWRNGKRVEAQVIVLLVRDPKSKVIRREKLWRGDSVAIGSGVWQLLSAERGNETCRAQVTLSRVGDVGDVGDD